jgi:hypothetical protein
MLALRVRINDVQMLWPRLLAQHGSLEDARSAFRRHAFSSGSWLILPTSQIHEIVETLGHKAAEEPGD